MEELIRANKVTSYWEGTGVATAIFYKTHDKIMAIKSDDQKVHELGFVMPEGTDEAPVTAAQKLAAYKDFVIANATAFGVSYDPVDRRSDEYKFPSRYDESNIIEYSRNILDSSIVKVLESLQNNVVAKSIKNGQLPEGTMVNYGIGSGVLSVTEKYGNGFLKYATVDYPIAISVAGNTLNTDVTVELISGQLKKPRNIGDSVLTMTGIKDMLIAANVIPKAEKPEKAEPVDGEAPADKPKRERKPKESE